MLSSNQNEIELEIITPDWGIPYLKPKRYKGLKGGRGSGKSHFFAEMMIEEHIINKDQQSVCVREIQKSLKFSAKKLLEDKIRLFGVSHLFDITITEIRRIGGTGVIIFQGMQDHTADSIKSLEGFDRCWVEESQSISERSMELLLPTIRSSGSEIWFSWNPNNPEDPIEKLFSTQDDDLLCTHINFTENVHVTKEIIKEAARHKLASPETYDHVWLGVANSGSEFAFINPAWIRSSIDAHKILSEFNDNAGRKVIGYDVADEEEHGSDTNASSLMSGSIVWETKEWKDGDVGESCRMVYHDAQIVNAEVVYDAVGLGAGTKAESNRLNKDPEMTIKVKFIAFIAGGSVINPDEVVIEGTRIINKDFFYNIKAQMWWKLKQRFYNTYLAITKDKKFPVDEMISLSSSNPLLDKLTAELSRPKIMYDNNSRVMVEKKKDMAKRGIKSPNLADSLVMCGVTEEDGINEMLDFALGLNQ